MVSRNRIDWEDPRLGSGVYEDMVAVLISRLHPASIRVDGAGGDGGRDVQIPGPNGVEIFELKSFTGRLGREKNRRRQVERSLTQAAQHNPVAWHLVVPIDHNPAEEAWFEKVTKKHSFPCTWRGKTWLDTEMSLRPEIARYFLDDGQHETLNLLRELHGEQAAFVNGVSDAMERVGRLAKRFNELSPHYHVAFATDPNGSVAVTLSERYANAATDAPISITPTFSFPNNAEGLAAHQAFQDSLWFGVPATITTDFIEKVDVEAPLGMGGSFTEARLELRGVEVPDAEHVSFDFRLLAENGLPLVQLPLTGTSRTRGERGGEVTLTEPSGAVTAVVRIDAVEKRFNATFHLTAPKVTIPSLMLPALYFIDGFRTGRFVEVVARGEVAGPPIPVPDGQEQEITGLIALTERLEAIQRLSHTYFPMPEGFTGYDLEAIDEAHRLLQGETVEGTWSGATFTLTPRNPDDADFQAFLHGEPRAFASESLYLLELGDQKYRLGAVRRICASAKVSEVRPSVTANAAEGALDISLVPGPDRTVTSVLVPRENPGGEELPSSEGDNSPTS